MVVYFNNDGTYKEDAVKAPVVVNDKPIGFISEVNESSLVFFISRRLRLFAPDESLFDWDYMKINKSKNLIFYVYIFFLFWVGIFI